MKKTLLTLTLTLFSVFAALGQNAKPAPTPPAAADDVVRISTSLIQIDVTVTDKSGKIITDLKPEDFEIYENGERQSITNFSFVAPAAPETAPATSAEKKAPDKSAVPVPVARLRPEQVRRTIALVVDDLGIAFTNMYFVRRALRKFVDEQMQPNDLVAIIRTGGGIGALQQFTSDKRQLYAAIERVKWNPLGRGRISSFEPLQANLESLTQTPGSAPGGDGVGERDAGADAENFRQSVYATGTLGAVNYIVNGMKELPGRKSVMLFSEGFRLFTQGPSGPESDDRLRETLRRLVDAANRASVVVYTMDVRGLETLGLTAADDTSGRNAQQIQQAMNDRRDELAETQDGLIYLARETGGTSVVNNNDFNQGIERMLNDQKGYYLIGYEPDSETFDPKTRRFNKLFVNVKRKDLRVRYRSGFFGIEDRQLAAAAPAAISPAQQLVRALTSPFNAGGIDVRFNALFGSEAKVGAYVRSLMYIKTEDLTFTDTPDGQKKTVFDVIAMSFGENGAPVDQISKTFTLTIKKAYYEEIKNEGFVYNFTFPIKKPGAYQMRAAIRDAGSGKVGSANQFVDVPNLKKNNLTLSGVVLENYTAAQWRKAAQPVSGDQTPADEMPNPLVDTSLRRFKRGTILRYGAEVYNAKSASGQKPQLTTQIRLFRDGKVILDGKQVPVDVAGQVDMQKINILGALNLGTEMTPGDYILQIIVTDNLAKEKSKISSQWVQFEVVD